MNRKKDRHMNSKWRRQDPKPRLSVSTLFILNMQTQVLKNKLTTKEKDSWVLHEAVVYFEGSSQMYFVSCNFAMDDRHQNTPCFLYKIQNEIFSPISMPRSGAILTQ